MPECGAMWAALRYRTGQAVALALLSALVTACAVFAPLYDRTMLQSLVDVRLAHASLLLSSVQLEAASRDVGRFSSDARPTPPPAPTALVDDFSAWARASYDAPILGWSDTLRGAVGSKGIVAGQLMWRTAACEHVTVAAGRCPERAGEVMVSTGDLEHLGLKVGQPMSVAEPELDAWTRPIGRRLRVVGAYTDEDRDWFVQVMTGMSGTFTEERPPLMRHDAWLTSEATFTTGRFLPSARSYVGLRLRPDGVGVDELLRLGDELTAIRSRSAKATSGPRLQLTTGLTDIADDVRSQQHDSHVIVPLLMAQLGLLCLVVLWLALRTVTDLRRNEVAIARLRGRGVRGGRRLLLVELLPAVALGVLPGVAVAWGGGLVAARLLPGDAGPELRLPVLVALVAVVVLLTATATLAAGRVGRMPVDALLRRSASVRRGWRVSALDAVLVTGCGVVVATFLAGGLDGPAALVAPSLVALFAGLLLAHLLTPVTAAVGRALLRRGRARTAVSLLDAGRSPALRSTVTVVTVAAALAVFSIDSLVVADRNRAAAAEQEAGAPVVALVEGRDVSAVDAATRDETGVTPVVRLQATEALATLAVHPAAFRRIALLPEAVGDTAAWHDLDAGGADPVVFTGTTLSLTVTDRGLSSTAPVTLGADIVEADQTFHVELGAVPREGSRRLSVPRECADGCRLVALTLSTRPGATMRGAVDVTDVRGDDTPVTLGDEWQPVDGADEGTAEVAALPGGLALTVEAGGEERVTVQQQWLPAAIPALVSDADGHAGVTLTGFDGRARAGQVAAGVPRIPGASDGTALVDVDVLRRGTPSGSDLRIELWARDEAALGRVVRTLRAADIGVVKTTRLSDIRQQYDESASAWSVALGLVVGLAAIGVALLLLAVLAVSGWRVRVRDLSALWLSGVRRRDVRRLAWTAQLPAVVVGVLVGAACGLVGAGVSMPIVPLFAEAPGVDTLDLATPLLPVAVVAGTVLAVLVAWSAGIGWAIARRASLERLKETA